MSSQTGVATRHGGALGVVSADFNGDGWIDFYVANDQRPNHLWMNQKNGSFREEALVAGCALNRDGKTEASMGVDAGDLDNDGDEDLFMTHLIRETNTLYLNNGRGWFEDQTFESELGVASMPYTGFGTAFLDYDNDGWLDILALHGEVATIEALEKLRDPYPLHQPNQLFHNLGNGSFEEVTRTGWSRIPALRGEPRRRLWGRRQRWRRGRADRQQQRSGTPAHQQRGDPPSLVGIAAAGPRYPAGHVGSPGGSRLP